VGSPRVDREERRERHVAKKDLGRGKTHKRSVTNSPRESQKLRKCRTKKVGKFGKVTGGVTNGPSRGKEGKKSVISRREGGLGSLRKQKRRPEKIEKNAGTSWAVEGKGKQNENKTKTEKG